MRGQQPGGLAEQAEPVAARRSRAACRRAWTRPGPGVGRPAGPSGPARGRPVRSLGLSGSSPTSRPSRSVGQGVDQLGPPRRPGGRSGGPRVGLGQEAQHVAASPAGRRPRRPGRRGWRGRRGRAGWPARPGSGGGGPAARPGRRRPRAGPIDSATRRAIGRADRGVVGARARAACRCRAAGRPAAAGRVGRPGSGAAAPRPRTAPSAGRRCAGGSGCAAAGR